MTRGKLLLTVLFLSLSSVSLQINCIPSFSALDKHLNIDQQTFTSNKLHTLCLSENCAPRTTPNAFFSPVFQLDTEN